MLPVPGSYRSPITFTENPMFQNVLVPVDFTEKNVRAIDLARDLANDSGGRVILLHVIETLDLPFEELESFYQKLEERARQELDQQADRLRAAEMEFDLELRYGKRAHEIIDFAEENPVDLIVMSSHRVDPDDPGMSWTSISYQVAILAQGPVLLIK